MLFYFSFYDLACYNKSLLVGKSEPLYIRECRKRWHEACSADYCRDKYIDFIDLPSSITPSCPS